MDQEQLAQARNFIYTDIQRELTIAEVSEKAPDILKQAGIHLGGGNFLCALALFCYIEFAGKLKFNNKKKDGSDYASKNFNDFFDALGESYKSFKDGFLDKNFVYDTFRCGLAHEYYIKHNCTVYMFGDTKFSGVGKTNKGDYYVVVKTLFEDFKVAFDKL